jgi:hypothetical protein
MSLKVALEELGFDPCHHAIELFENPAHAGLWEAAARGEPVSWDEFLGNYQATVDWPACSFYKELMEEYPDAKVLLSVRDPERWYESTANTIYGMRKGGLMSPLGPLMRVLAPARVRGARAMDKIVWEDTFSDNFEDRQYAIEVFNRHIEEVKEHVPADQLLVYDVKDGWGPLCEFLNVEVPKDEPFPHLNDTVAFGRMIRKRLVITFAALIGGTLLVGLALLYILSRRASGRS